MYSVEALIPDMLGLTVLGDQWTSVYDVPQLHTEQEELIEARNQSETARHFYVNVRIIKESPSGSRSVVR